MLRIEVEKLAIGGRVLAEEAIYSLERGARHIVRGPNGCGKSLLVDTVCGVHWSRTVRVSLDGRRLRHGTYPRWREGLRRLAQSPVLAPDLLVSDVTNRAFIRRAPTDPWMRRCRELLESGRVDFQRTVGAHSFGQQRLLELVFSLASGDWILLDEPFAGIASTHVDAVLALIEVASSQGRGVLVVDHTGVELAGARITEWPSPKPSVAMEPADWRIGPPRQALRRKAWHVRRLAAGDRTFLRDATIAATAGTMTVLRGSNGTGKSTILRALARQPHPFRCVEDSVVDGAGDVFLSPQPPKLVGELSVRANLKLMEGRSGTGTEFAKYALPHFGLSATVLFSRAESLSGGEAAVVALVGAVASGAPVLLLDEPLESLSPSGVSAGVSLIRAALRTGRTIVVATHTERLLTGVPEAAVIDLHS